MMLASHHVHPMPIVFRDLTCIVCGLGCTTPEHHREKWRDAGHTPLVVEELEATPEPQRLIHHRAPVGLRSFGGARR